MDAMFKNFIDGEWVEGAEGRTFQSINPADTAEVVGVLSRAGRGDVDRAVEATRAAWHGWRRMPAPKRGEILFRAGEMLLRRKQELGKLMTREMGKVIAEALGDIQEAIDMSFCVAGETIPSELPDKDCKSVRVPIGVCGLITPWNFPLAIPAWKIMPALVSGNTVVFKPSSLTPVCAAKLVEILQEAGLPRGC